MLYMHIPSLSPQLSRMSVTVSSPLMANSSRSANGDHFAGFPDAQYAVVEESVACNDAIVAEKPKMGIGSEIQEIAKKLEEVQLKCSEKCALNIEVIDDTALIDTSTIGKGKFNRNFQESGKEKPQPKRREGRNGRKKKKKTNVEERVHDDHVSVEMKEVILVYSREEMEAVRYENLEDQKKKWAEVYCGLGAVVAAEYDGLVTSAAVGKKRGVSSFGFVRRPSFQKSASLDAAVAMGKRNHLNIFVH